MNTLQNTYKVPKTTKTTKTHDFRVLEVSKSEKRPFFCAQLFLLGAFFFRKNAPAAGTERRNRKMCPNGKMSGKKRLFRGESYTENPKSVPHLAGHLQSEMSYKAVYNKRLFSRVFTVFRVFTCFGGFGVFSLSEHFCWFPEVLAQTQRLDDTHTWHTHIHGTYTHIQHITSILITAALPK